MSRLITGFALVAVFLVAAVANAGYVPGFTQEFKNAAGEVITWNEAVQGFMDWRTTRGANYSNYNAKVETLFAIEKGGAQGATNGGITQWSYNDNAIWLEQTEDAAPSFWLHIDGSQLTTVPNILDMGIVMTGAAGSRGSINPLGFLTGNWVTGTSGAFANVLLNIPGMTGTTQTGIPIVGSISIPSWASLGYMMTLLSVAGDALGDITIENQVYLNGAQSSSTTVNNANDSQLNYLWATIVNDMIAGADGIGSAQSHGDVGFRLNTALRNQSGVAFLMVTGWPVPEPGTMAIFGLGLAGLGVARRRMKK